MLVDMRTNPLSNIIGRPKFDLHAHLAHAKLALPIIVDGVTKSFGSVNALAGVSLVVQPGTVMALLGPNGAGKTTLVRILTTLMKPDAGTIQVAGYDVVRDATALRSIIGLAGQSVAVDDNLTSRENLILVGRLYHLGAVRAKDRADELLRQFDLTDAADRTAKTYSGGMRRRLDLAASLIGRPKVLFLDEPTSGLDPRSRLDLWNVINQLVADGTTILLTTQYLEEADHLADHIAVIDRGRVIAEGTADELKSQAGGDVLEIHLADHAIVAPTAQALSDLGIAEPQIDHEGGKIVLPVAGGSAALVQAVRRLDMAGIEIADIALRRPTLDDVFLALTGHSAGV